MKDSYRSLVNLIFRKTAPDTYGRIFDVYNGLQLQLRFSQNFQRTDLLMYRYSLELPIMGRNKAILRRRLSAEEDVEHERDAFEA